MGRSRRATLQDWWLRIGGRWVREVAVVHRFHYEDDTELNVTFAKEMKKLGTPDIVIFKTLSTASEDITYLTEADVDGWALQAVSNAGGGSRLRGEPDLTATLKAGAVPTETTAVAEPRMTETLP
jgi:hypothetical protein